MHTYEKALFPVLFEKETGVAIRPRAAFVAGATVHSASREGNWRGCSVYEAAFLAGIKAPSNMHNSQTH